MPDSSLQLTVPEGSGQVGFLSTNEADILLSQLQRHARHRRFLAMLCNGLNWVVGGNAIAAGFAYAYHLFRSRGDLLVRISWHDWSGIVGSHATKTGHVISFGGAWIILMAILVFSSIGVRILTRKQVGLSRALPLVEDPRALALLIEAMHLGDAELRKEAMAVAIPLLHSIGPNDADLLPKAQRELLYDDVATGENDLRSAVLHAMTLIGTDQDAEQLGELLEEEEDKDRHASLELCVSRMQERLAFEKATSTLLRPAAPITTAEDRLLRPSHLSPADTSKLLRPTEHLQA